MTEDHVKSEIRDDIAWITLNRPEKRNALTIEMMRGLAEAFARLDQTPQVRAAIVTAEGPQFSAGIDVMALAGQRGAAGDLHPARWLRRLAEELQQCLHRIEQTEVPIIGALHGKVMGLGLELALAFDLRVAAEDCACSLPETRLGLTADVGGVTRLARLAGPSRAKDMLFTARPVHADEALAWGLVDRVAPADKLLETAEELARSIAQNAPLAVGLSKLLVDQGHGASAHTQMFMERLGQSQLILTEDFAEALTAFVEKRPPVWNSR